MALHDKIFWFAERSEPAEIRDGITFSPHFDENGLMPVITVDDRRGDVLMLGWMNEEALLRTLETRKAVYYSRERECLWHKGATSGHTQTVKEIQVDWNQHTLLLRVDQHGAGCSPDGHRSCFYRRLPIGRELEMAANSQAMPLIPLDEDKTFDPDEVYG